MKHLIKLTFLLLCFLMPATAIAHDFEVDGIYYNINGNRVTVTYQGTTHYEYDEYSGDVTIPSSVYYNGKTYTVTAIGDDAFRNCSELTSVTLPNSMITIGSSAFSYCSKLASVTIPNAVTSIGSNAFKFCKGLTSATIGDAVKTIDDETFFGCNNLVNVTIGNAVTSIGSSAFEGCSLMSSVNIPNTIKTIKSRAFYSCRKLETITIPNSVTVIGDEAFSHCLDLIDVYSYILDPSQVTTGSNLFYLNSSEDYAERTLHVPLTTLETYQNATEWAPYFGTIVADIFTPITFQVGEFQYITTSESTVTVTGYDRSDSWNYGLGTLDIEIPSHITYKSISYIVTAIGDNVFGYESDLDDFYCITIPNTIVSIGKSVIYGINNYNYYVVCLAETPPAMNESFNPNDNIELFVLADAYPLYKELNDNNHYFSSIHITDGERTPIPTYEVTYLTQEWGLTENDICYRSYEGGGLDDYYSYNSNNQYGCIISNSSNIRRIIEYAGGYVGFSDVTNVYDCPYDNCCIYINTWWTHISSLIVISYSIEEGKSPSHIGYDSYGYFSPMWDHHSFDFIDSRIAYSTRNNEASVTSSTFGTDGSGYGYYSFYSGNVVIPSTATKYDNYHIEPYCTYPVTTIGTGAFGTSQDVFENFGYVNTDLISVTLPASIDSVSSYAFEHAPNLSYIKCLGRIPAKAFGDSFDEDVLQNTTLYVPMAALSAYKAADGWKDFQHIVGFTDYDFLADGIYYTITGDNEAMVTFGESAYQGIINIPTNVTYDGVTYNVTGISDGAFTDATLQSLILPVAISTVGNTAFNNCHIGSLVISGNGTWSAGAVNCEVDNLYVMSTVTGIQGLQVNPATTVYSYSTLPPTCNEQTFTGYDAALHVPASALAAYFTTSYWNTFINITSDAVEPTGLTINKDSVEVLVGNQVTLSAAAIPADATPSDILWTSSDQSIATVADGVITALHVGECDIKAYLLDKIAVCHVTVTEIAPTEITVTPEFAKLEVGSQLTLTATVSPDDATDKYVTWSTTNSAVATVDSLGNVLAVGTGECFITATCRDKQAMCHIIVVDHFIFITLDEHEVSLLPNHMIVLTPSVMPENTNLVVTSTNPNVAAARLANGKIQVVGITEGRTIIKVNSTDGYAEADSCLVKVYTLRGDVNNDGYVNISDVTSLINHLLGGQDIINEVNADTNNDGKINISDVTRLINYLLGGDELDPIEEPIEGAETFTVNGVSFTMLPVEGGTFTMGATPEQGTSDPWTVEYPTHEVTVSSFSIGETEVTQALWQAVMGSNPSSFTGDLNRPVEMVSWDDCQAFIAQLNQMTGRTFRMPTEAEWEYAARGGKKTQVYKYAGSNDIDEVAWYDTNSCDGVGPDSPDYGTHPVASKKANELGLYDMSGNVWEWCQDWFGNYSSEPQTNPTGPESGDNRVYRGGSWINYSKNCRVSSRFHWGMTGENNIGLRLVLQ